jgi:D-alanine-D-alanine ligase-like ATP-grasp enzyme
MTRKVLSSIMFVKKNKFVLNEINKIPYLYMTWLLHYLNPKTL